MLNARKDAVAIAMQPGAGDAAGVVAPDADARLLDRCRRGDADAFETLFRKYHTYVYNVSLGMLGNGDDAADVTQETFLRIHRGLDHFRGDSSFSTWVYRVAVNLCISELRRRARGKLQYLDDVTLEETRFEAEYAPSPQEAVQTEEERRVVRAILAALPPDYRAIMVLRHYQQLAYEEIAEVLHLSLSQVKTRLFRARRMFKDRYSSYLGDQGALLAG